MTPFHHAAWRPSRLVVAHLISLLLITSWLLEPTRSLWLSLDERFFWAVNHSLTWGKGWQQLWAIANNRTFDLVAGVSMLALFAHQALFRDRAHLNRYIGIILMLFVVLLLMLLISKALPVVRPSATAEFPEALRLSQLVPEISTKDYSSDSFPGDHGLVLLLCAGFAWAYLPLGHGMMALLFMVLFTLPRLMSGAHWLSDELVGAVSVGLPTLGWLFATPLHTKALEWFEQRISRLQTLLLKR